ncbi:MAG TPA: hypothetical protein VMK13_06915 [Streptosporangiaceae bacterium]|nr:hypothetical protein [Streptosporangiaceae bacterium]
MPSPARTDPAYVPIRTTPWPARRTPRSVLLAGVVLLGIAVAIGLALKPDQAQRAADLRGFLQTMNADIGSCAAGVSQSYQALTAISSGASRDVRTAIGIADTGAANCSPANNEVLDNLVGYQVPESLFSYHLRGVVTGLVNWAAPDAQQVQADVARVLAAPYPGPRARAIAALRSDRAKLDAQRAAVDRVMNAAISALHPGAGPPRLPG